MGRVVIPYKPRPLAVAIHDCVQRWRLIVAHRRFGKTVLCINDLIRSNFKCKLDNPRHAYIAPQYKQAKTVAWDYLKLYSRVIPGIKINEAELRVDYPNGGRITLYGADNPDSLRGIYLDGVILDEYAQMHPKLFTEVIRPALSDRKGWATFIGTPKGRNKFYTLYNDVKDKLDWFVRVFKASETGIVDQEELDDARAIMSDDEYMQEYECSWTAAIKGAYYAKQMAAVREQKRIMSVPIESNLEVRTYWDLGIADSMVIWQVQEVGKELRIIDCYGNNNESLQHYINYLHDFRDKNEIVYSEHWAPHDIEVRELSTGKTRRELAKAMGIKFKIVPNIPVQDGIDTVRTILGRCWFDAERCADGINALENYRKEFDEKKDVFRDGPLHDWCSDYADAFRMFAVAYKPAGRGVIASLESRERNPFNPPRRRVV